MGVLVRRDLKRTIERQKQAAPSERRKACHRGHATRKQNHPTQRPDEEELALKTGKQRHRHQQSNFNCHRAGKDEIAKSAKGLGQEFVRVQTVRHFANGYQPDQS